MAQSYSPRGVAKKISPLTDNSNKLTYDDEIHICSSNHVVAITKVITGTKQQTKICPGRFI